MVTVSLTLAHRSLHLIDVLTVLHRWPYLIPLLTNLPSLRTRNISPSRSSLDTLIEIPHTY